VGGVGAGELEAVEEGGGVAAFELTGGEGVDDELESDLDGLAVLEGAELDVLAGDEVAGAGGGLAVGGVALVEAGVEVAVRGAVKLGRAAGKAVGLDVATDGNFHGGAPFERWVPPGGGD
jgi:hypothetical protein